MSFYRNRRSHKGRPVAERRERPEPEAAVSLASTGAEAAYLKSSIGSHATVTVVLRGGERLRGRIRYFDRDCFSIGLIPRGPNILIRKSSVLYISED